MNYNSTNSIEWEYNTELFFNQSISIFSSLNTIGFIG